MKQVGIGRREIKFGISTAEYYMLSSKLKWLMQRDQHAKLNGGYHIRSTYFDNFEDRILAEKKEGYLNRDKGTTLLKHLQTIIKFF